MTTPVEIPGYRVLYEQGGLGASKGGMARVFKAVRINGEVTRAVKVLRGENAASKELVEGFLREHEIMLDIHHPNIARVYQNEVGTVQSGGETLHYFALEWVEGCDLREYVSDRNGVGEADARTMVDAILSAIEDIHAKQMIHRDIRPANIRVEAGTNRIVLLDFGIAVGGGRRWDSRPWGGPPFISPEHGTTHLLCPESDLYCVGLVLFFLLTGQVPFGAKNPEENARQHLEDPPPSPREFVGSISPGMEKVVLKALEKEPTNRFRTARGFRRALAASSLFPNHGGASEAGRENHPLVAQMSLIVIFGLLVFLAVGFSIAKLVETDEPIKPPKVTRTLTIKNPFGSSLSAVEENLCSVSFEMGSGGERIVQLGVDPLQVPDGATRITVSCNGYELATRQIDGETPRSITIVLRARSEERRGSVSLKEPPSMPAPAKPNPPELELEDPPELILSWRFDMEPDQYVVMANGFELVSQGGSFSLTDAVRSDKEVEFTVSVKGGDSFTKKVSPSPGERIEWEINPIEHCFVFLLPGGVEMEFRRVRKGDFRFGYSEYEAKENVIAIDDKKASDTPARIMQDYYIAARETSQRQFVALGKGSDNPTPAKWGYNPGIVGTDVYADFPVLKVEVGNDLLGADGYIMRFNQYLQKVFPALTGWRADLPSELQWEYACRAGTSSPFSDPDIKLAYGKWVKLVSGERTGLEFLCNCKPSSTGPLAVVGQNRVANAWGLFDMHGNAAEWCWDSWKGGRQNLVLRGGSWSDTGHACRSAARKPSISTKLADFKLEIGGFRLVLIPSGESSG